MLRILFILLNLLAFPGLGTLCSGRKKTGICQLSLAACGFSLTLWGAGVLVDKILLSGLPLMEMSQAIADETLMPHSEFLVQFAWALMGTCLFGIAWIWAAFTPQGKKAHPPGATPAL